MIYFKQTYFSPLVSFLFILLINISHAEAALKGKPGSAQRDGWCKSKMDSCVDNANSDCDETYPESSLNDVDLALCKSSEVNICKNTYGSSSDCWTRDRVNGRSNKVKKVDRNGKTSASPTTSPHSSKNRLKPTQSTKPHNTKNAQISSEDCTFYGGTVQKSKSCASKQSCLINNNNGCISKKAK